MPVKDILVVYTIQLLLLLLPSFGLSKMFPKAGIASWKAFVPVLNTWEMQKAARRPTYWVYYNGYLYRMDQAVWPVCH
jgi:signal peptidase I